MIVQKGKYLPKDHLRANFKTDYFRICGKIAFNFLAFVKGEEFVKHEQFNGLRNWIATGGEYGLVNIDHKSGNPLLKSRFRSSKRCTFYILYFK